MSILQTFFDKSHSYQHFVSWPQKSQFQIHHPYKGGESTGCLVHVCVVLCACWIFGCRSLCNGCVKFAWCCGCMRNTIVFVSWTSPIVLEWLYRCDNDFSADFLNFGAGDLPFQVIFSVIENRVFFAWAPRSIRFWSCNFWCRCARFYCVLQCSIWRSHCNRCAKVAWRRGCMRNTTSLIVLEWLHQGRDSDFSADFLNFGACDFRFKIPFRKCFKIVFCLLSCRGPVLEYFVQALQYRVVPGGTLCKLCSTK